MSNLEILDKLTKGKDAIETVTIQIEGEETEIQLRPLTSGELSKLQTIEKKGFTLKIGVNGQGRRQSVKTDTDVDVNAGEFSQYQNEAMFQAIAWSMSVDGNKVESSDVESFLPGVPELIFDQVIRISKLKDKDLTIIKNFRKE